MTNKIYNFFSYIKYQIFHTPLLMHIGIERSVKEPALTVIFLHGIAATSSTWRTTFSELSKNHNLDNARLIALDLLGFGKSPQADWIHYDYNDYVDSLNKTIKKLKVNTPIILVGHSMGSLISAKFAETYPEKVKELILVSPPILMPDESKKLPDKFYLKTYSSIANIANEPAIKTLANFVDKVSSFTKKYLRMKSFELSMNNIVLNAGNFKTFCKLKTPTTIIHGRFDPLVFRPNLSKIITNNPNFTSLICVMGDHDMTSSKRKKINLLLERALKNEII